MRTAKELVDLINAAKICTPHRVEDTVYPDEVVEVAIQDRDEQRWFAMGTIVFQTGKEFFGVRGPISKSEDASYGELGVTCWACEMEQVPSVTYQRKKVI